MTAFVTAYLPFLLSLHVDQPALERDLRGRIATFVAVALLGVGLPFAVFGPELVSVAAPGYDGAVKAISPLYLRRLPTGWRRSRGTHPATPPHRRICGAVGDHGDCQRQPVPRADSALRPRGSRVAAFGGYALLAAMYWWWGRRVDDAPYEPVRLVAAFAIAAVAGEAWRIDLSSGALTVLLKLAVCAGFVVACGSRT